MQLRSYKLKKLLPPQDDLFAALMSARLNLREGDIVAVSSKVVSIHEGQCVPEESVTDKDALIKKEADWYVAHKKVKSFTTFFTITRGVLIGRSGIDSSNGNGHYVLYPKDPQRSAKRILTWIKKTYGVQNVGVVIVDSHSTPLHRGAIGFALSYAGFNPLTDYRGTKDIFGRIFKVEQANVADALAAAAALVMGEGAQQTPVAVIRDAPVNWNTRVSKKPWSSYELSLDDDKFSPFLKKMTWRKGGKTT